MAVPPNETLQRDPTFNRSLGLFYNAWTSTDMAIDFAIGMFLKISHEHAQLLTAGMQFGAKIRILRGLVQKSNHERKAAIIGTLNKLQNESKRNVLAHSYIIGDRDSVTFLERSAGGEYWVRRHRFTLIQWNSHVTAFVLHAQEFWDALGVSPEEFHTFALAAVRSSKS